MSYHKRAALPRVLYFSSILIVMLGQPLTVWGLNDEPKPADEVFVVEVRQESHLSYSLSWNIADNYYLYKDKISLHTKEGEVLAPILSTNHQPQTDEFFGDQDVYYYYAYAQLQLTEQQVAQPLILSYQGCWDEGLCYPVQYREVHLTETPQVIAMVEPNIPVSGYDFYLGTLSQTGIPFILLLFFLAGIGLTFTPCVLPMLPIISGTLTMGRHDVKHRAALAMTYVLTMALVYSLLGLLSAWLGYRLHSLLGSPVLLIVLAGLVGLLAMTMFGVVQLRLPMVLKQRINTQLNLTMGSYRGAVLWGAVSPLIVGTCLSAPLAGAMLYLAERGNPLLGAAALFVLALGMGTPLLLFVVGLSRILPTSGPWLDKIRIFFSYVLLLLAVFILSSLLPFAVIVSSSLVIVMIMLWHLFSPKYLYRGLLVSCVLGFIAYGIGYWVDFDHSNFKTVTEVATLESEQRSSLLQGRPMMVYYYADWCISCRELEWLVFRDEEVVTVLKEVDVVKVDVTRHGQASLKLLDYHGILGPPSLVFIDRQGSVDRQLNLVGTFTKQELQLRLERLLGPQL